VACYFSAMATNPTSTDNEEPESYEPELGQMMFGNAHGEVGLGKDEDYVSEQLYALSEALGRRDPDNQSHGLLGGEWGYGNEFKNDVFEMHPYYWGDCHCGFETEEYQWGMANPHPPTCFNTRYWDEHERLHLLDLDFRVENERMVEWSKAQGYVDAPYGMAVYCDCGTSERYQEWRQTHDHDPECRVVLPNFRAGTVSVAWYKYVGRGMSVNRPVTHAEWKRIFESCFASLL
jgi:hypothetical protein